MQVIQDMKSPEQVVWEFYGTPLKAMRRIQLWRLCDIKKIPYPKGCTKDTLLAILEQQEMILGTQGQTLLSPASGMTEETFWRLINGPTKTFNEFTGGMMEGQTNIEEMRQALEPAPHFETLDDISTLGWHDLKARAKAEGHEVLPTMKRPEIEDLLRGNAA